MHTWINYFISSQLGSLKTSSIFCVEELLLTKELKFILPAEDSTIVTIWNNLFALYKYTLILYIQSLYKGWKYSHFLYCVQSNKITKYIFYFCYLSIFEIKLSEYQCVYHISWDGFGVHRKTSLYNNWRFHSFNLTKRISRTFHNPLNTSVSYVYFTNTISRK